MLDRTRRNTLGVTMESISIVIPAFNEEDNIGKCLQLLNDQMKDGDEIIVIDNGSGDNTAEVANSFDDVTVLSVPDKKIGEDISRPIGFLRQIGTKKAENEIVASTDADTLPPDGWLNRIRKRFEEDEELSLIWGEAVDSKGVPIRNVTGKYLTIVGGVSGCNTAFRKSHFEELEKGYVGWPMFEDVALVTRMSREGKTVHDKGLKMVTHLDRKRYQTIPMLAGSAASILAGHKLSGKVGKMLKGAGASLAATELTYENFTETPFHHDEVGAGVLFLGNKLGSDEVVGAGTGVVAHHFLTEGVSALPSNLEKNTDMIIEGIKGE